ncbi:MAG: hypothetical protein LAO21_00800 [Acidobacteriia bacterium]|nr:hypothetical protein [Terriglobia bacterium]
MRRKNGSAKIIRVSGDFVSLIILLLSVSTTCWAQGNSAAAHADRAGMAHGDGWQKGAVKTWVAQGTVTIYRQSAESSAATSDTLQSQQTFPVTVIHQADPAGGGSKGDKLQRFVFKAPDASPDGSTALQSSFVNPRSPERILTREGTDGNDQWHSAGPLSTKAAGHVQRFIESQTERSLEALFNFRKHGKNLADLTDRFAAQGQGANGAADNGNDNGNGNANGHRDRAHPTPAFEAARNRKVIEVADSSGNGHGPQGGAPGQSTRYYIDDATSLVTRMEFDYDTATDPFSNQPVALTEVYEFSDYRDVPLATPDPFSAKPTAKAADPGATVKFPFRIDRYIAGQLAESLVFTRVALGRTLAPENFRK